MGKSLDEAASYAKPLFVQLLAECEAQGVPCRIEDVGRDEATQAQNLAKGVSWTTNSKHLPQPPEDKSEAIDIVPVEILNLNKKDWDPGNPVWAKIGLIGEGLGLFWGGRWTHINGGKGDPGHFQYIHPKVMTA